MSGHNRWSKIKRAKAITGAKKGTLFTKLIKEITVSARMGGGDPAGNSRLRVAVLAAREANMPSDTITRAIKKGTGELEGVSYEDVLYEGYGPGGVAMLVECLTDNLNRTAGDVRSTFSQFGGNLGTPGSVKFIFQKKGTITVKAGPTEDQVMEKAIDAGAEDVINHAEEGFEVRTEPAELHAVAAALEKGGLKLAEQKTTYLPQTTVKLERDKAKQLLKLIDNLEESDDVQNVYANFEMDEKLMEELSG
jgi:YebC/PmpR family DNA-binding regulatory protein